MQPPLWQKKGKYFPYKGQQIFYREAGKGEILLLIHGFPTASWDWHKIWEELKTAFHLLAPDMIGFGFSGKPVNYAYSIMDQADLHECFCQEMNVTSMHILAHDYGVTVAQELLARHQERTNKGEPTIDIQSVCMLNGGIFSEMHRPRLVQRLLLSPLGGWLSPFMGKRQLHKTFQRIFGPNTQPSIEEIDDFWKLIEYNNGKKVLHKLMHYMRDRRTYRDRWVDVLVESTVPIRLINGAKDPISGKHMTNYYQQLIPNPDVISLEHIGHYPQTEAPEEVLKYFFDFVKTL